MNRWNIFLSPIFLSYFSSYLASISTSIVFAR